LLRKAGELILPHADTHVVDFSSASMPDLGSRASNTNRLILAKEPSAWLIERIAAGHVRTIAVLEDPLDAVIYSRTLKGCTLLEGVRDQSAATASALALHGKPSVFFMSRNIPLNARDLAAEILQFVGWRVAGAEREMLLSAFGGPAAQPLSLEKSLAAQVPYYATPVRPDVDFSRDDESAAVSQALDPLIKAMAGLDLEAIIWPMALLLEGNDFVRPAPAWLDLTGPARNLVWGPFLCLPPARYSCRYVMKFDEGAAQTRFSLEVHGKRPLAEHRFTPASSGTMALDFELDIDGPDHWIDLRFVLSEGTIDGRASAVRAEWRLLSAAADTSP